ncbi:MAG: NAD(P)H-dependent oxidoreductase [Cyanobacteria bacterium P01_E01_bin.42]
MSLLHSPKLLGIAASLRNARWGLGNQELIDSLKNCADEAQLLDFLAAQSDLHLENFFKAGRDRGKSFIEIYENLKRNKGNRGLSNSEVALAAGLWSALQYDVDIQHLSLSEYFLPSGKNTKVDELKEKLIASDGILISGPVYFGDRGSLTQSFIDLIRQDAQLKMQLEGKLYAGIAVGSKRNGGQETTLIYQMWDLINLGLFAVGNDSDTTSQYGGTGQAGDIGTMYQDRYGLDTSMGTGRRIAKLLRRLSYQRELQAPVKILFPIVQDCQGQVKSKVKDLIHSLPLSIEAKVINIAESQVIRCLACDFCPTHIDIDSVYRCIINTQHDALKIFHQDLLDCDAIVPVALSLTDTSKIQNNYQKFIERTRYLRRGDYALSNQIVIPLIFEELGSQENLPMRIMTSMIRHHTILAKPLIGYLYQDSFINQTEIQQDFSKAIGFVKKLAAARLTEGDRPIKYNPVGYYLSMDKDKEDERLNVRKVMIEDRHSHLQRESQERLKPI